MPSTQPLPNLMGPPLTVHTPIGEAPDLPTDVPALTYDTPSLSAAGQQGETAVSTGEETLSSREPS